MNKSLLLDKTIFNLTQENFDVGFGIEWIDGRPHQEERENLDKYLTMRFMQNEGVFVTLPDGS